ncbi:ABC transporter permease [Paenibacillus agaridevorans]|uniref:ABC transporter permease n=1 Tax=Paenibacillus agaridevorans TaxID=171404 RepID=A0A2R5ENJ2_9BACL|nr:carbohydrate ABC transporter permease [Paenibacillus agaridevorans]GBG08222.1 ABC transporter permease [Paenibacillus agaridevorans]
MSYAQRGRLGRMLLYIPLVGLALIALFPLYWVFVTSLQLPSYQNEEMESPVSYVESVPPKLYPYGITEYWSQWDKKRDAEKLGDEQAASFHAEKMQEVVAKTFTTYSYLFKSTDVLKWLWNTTYIAILGTFGTVLFDTMAGYVLAKKQFPGRMLVFWLIIATMMIPDQVTLVPSFMIVRLLDLFDTHWAVILPGLAGAFGVFLMRQFMIAVPSELLEAAKIDGAGEWRTFRTIVIPMAAPAMAALGIFSFVGLWNSFLWPIIVINDSKMLTLTAGLKTLQDANLSSFKLLMTGAAVAAVPIMIYFLLFQRYFVKGLTVGGVKE